MSTKLQQLTGYLMENLETGQIEGWVDQCSIEPVTSFHGEYYEICRHRNTCTIYIERFSGDAGLLSALLTVWLAENDAQRSDYALPPPEMDVEPLDSGDRQNAMFDVTISVDFMDSVLIKSDNEGAINWHGQNWSIIDSPMIDTATNVQGVNHD